jgi:hypothetical protein
MLLEIFILFNGLAFLFMLLALLKKDIVIYSFIAVILFIILALNTFRVETNFCEVVNETTSSWSCYTKITTDATLGYFYSGLGLFMLIYGIIMAFVGGGEAIQSELRGNL